MIEGGLLSIRYMMQTPRIPNPKPYAHRHGRPHFSILSKEMHATGKDLRGPASGRQEEYPDDLRVPNLPPQKQGGVG